MRNKNGYFEELNDIKVLLSQKNKASKKAKELLVKVPKEFIVRFLTGNVEGLEQVNYAGDSVYLSPDKIVDNNGKVFDLFIYLGDSYFDSQELIFEEEGNNSDELVRINIYDGCKIAQIKNRINSRYDKEGKNLKDAIEKFYQQNAGVEPTYISVEYLKNYENDDFSATVTHYAELLKAKNGEKIVANYTEVNKNYKERMYVENINFKNVNEGDLTEIEMN